MRPVIDNDTLVATPVTSPCIDCKEETDVEIAGEGFTVSLCDTCLDKLKQIRYWTFDHEYFSGSTMVKVWYTTERRVVEINNASVVRIKNAYM